MKVEESLQKTLKKYNDTLSLLGAEKIEEKLNYEDIIYIHDSMIEKYGGSYGVRDNNLLQSVSINPYQSCFGTDLYPTIFDKAAKLLYDFCNYQVFVDGNKRTGVAVSNTLLIMNDYELTLTEIEMYQLAMKIANNEIELEEVQQIFKGNCKIDILEKGENYDKGNQKESESTEATNKQHEESDSR